MAEPIPEVERELDRRVEALGYELVHVEWAGSGGRPILRLRIDVRGGSDPRDPRGGVTVDDCAVVSRGLEPWLDGLESMPEPYVLEVSSPGVERPLTRERDWSRFVGEQVALKGGKTVLADRATYLEGELLGPGRDSAGREVVRLKLAGGEELEVVREDIRSARLLFRWS
ncbi:MAG TPA: ribosome maturation factor RimP [Longimicrobiales bacterium]|nr:ribosome maturation factor RimP [Longimicrobiales bacterium]